MYMCHFPPLTGKLVCAHKPNNKYWHTCMDKDAIPQWAPWYLKALQVYFSRAVESSAKQCTYSVRPWVDHNGCLLGSFIQNSQSTSDRHVHVYQSPLALLLNPRYLLVTSNDKPESNLRKASKRPKHWLKSVLKPNSVNKLHLTRFIKHGPVLKIELEWNAMNIWLCHLLSYQLRCWTHIHVPLALLLNTRYLLVTSNDKPSA